MVVVEPEVEVVVVVVVDTSTALLSIGLLRFGGGILLEGVSSSEAEDEEAEKEAEEAGRSGGSLDSRG